MTDFPALVDFVEQWLFSTNHIKHFEVVRGIYGPYIKLRRLGSVVAYIEKDGVSTHERALQWRLHVEPEIFNPADPKFFEKLDKHLKICKYFPDIS